MRLIAARGSMNLGESKGGLPPDELVEDDDQILSDKWAARKHYNPGARIQIAVAVLALLRDEG